MAEWIKTDHFKSLNVGFAMDEGIANPGEEMRCFYSERMTWCECTDCKSLLSRNRFILLCLSSFIVNPSGPALIGVCLHMHLSNYHVRVMRG